MLKRLRAFLFLAVVAVSLSLGGSPPQVADAGGAMTCSVWSYDCHPYSYACYTGSDGRTYYCTGTSCYWVQKAAVCCGNTIALGGGLVGF